MLMVAVVAALLVGLPMVLPVLPGWTCRIRALPISPFAIAACGGICMCAFANVVLKGPWGSRAMTAQRCASSAPAGVVGLMVVFALFKGRES
ncbi:MAG: hypothetical protein ACLT98_07415 [Eggerthellaceae bacterium]